MRPDTRKRVKKLKPVVLAFALMYAVTVTLGSTFAWMVSTDSKINRFKSEQNQFSVTAIDVFDPDDPWKGDNKQVTAENTGDIHAFIRILVLPVVVKDNIPLQARIGDEVIITFPDIYNSTTNPDGKWIYGDDGYYYYLDVLDPGETAQPYLFKDVRLNSGLSSDYDGASLTVQIKVEAVNINTYTYRDAWWNGVTPAGGPLSVVDNKMKSKARQ